MITTNQTKQWCRSNQYFQYYRNLGDLAEPLEHSTLSDRFQLKYKRMAKNIEYEVKYDKFTNKRVVSVSDYNRNVNYSRAWKEFEHKFKTINQYQTIYAKKFYIDDDSCLCILEWSSRCSMRNNGTWRIEIYDCSEGDEIYLLEYPFIGADKFFEYNGILDSEHIVEATKKHIEKYLYPKGNFRELQMIYYWDKKRVKQDYRYHINSRRKGYNVDYEENERSTIAWIKRNFNIDISNVDFYDGIDTVNRLGKQDKMTVLRRFDYSFADHLDGDIGELEMAYWEEVETYPTNSYFVN